VKGADVRDEGGKRRYKYHGDKRREATREMCVCDEDDAVDDLK